MKTMVITLMGILAILNSCTVVEPIQKPKEAEFFLARVTFYTDCPIYGRKTASQRIAVQGTTVAAAKTVPFGTEYRIPRLAGWIKTDGVFRVDDRGPAVDAMTASKGKFPVIDVYVSSSSTVKRLGAFSGNIFKVYNKTP